jgi:hypothetical protein
LVETMLEAHDRLYLEQQSYARTIAIPTLGIHSTDFGLSREQAQALYRSGREAAAQFLSGWSFDHYLAAFRHGKRRSRREELAEQMRLAAAVPPTAGTDGGVQIGAEGGGRHGDGPTRDPGGAAMAGSTDAA